ncbi:MAG: hypothetical protein ACJAV2_003755, partial [Myxococcota bacterium]
MARTAMANGSANLRVVLNQIAACPISPNT